MFVYELSGCGFESRCRGEVNFNFLITSRDLKNFKEGWKHVAEAGLLKRGGWPFSYLVFSRFIIFTFRNYFTLCKIVLRIWRKIIFFCYHNFMKKVILSCLKMNQKIFHNNYIYIIYIYIYCRLLVTVFSLRIKFVILV